jgi:hypothetical protein
MMLFICHASEDKDDFVAPLAAELRKKYEVWYDDYELTLGDSLPEKIDDGLKRCDFGIVVLSKAFFAKKKWGRKELDGLIALEVKRGKMILPVLKGVTHDDVEKYSPILASKVTVSESEGLLKVIEEIQLAVGVSNRQRGLTALDIAAQSVEALRQTVTEHQRAEQLSFSEQGANLVRSSIDTVWDTIHKALYVDPASPVVPKFQFHRQVWNNMYVCTVRGMHLNLYPTNVALNSVVNARLEVRIFQRLEDNSAGSVPDIIMLLEIEFRPTFRSGDQVVWVNPDKTATYTSEGLAAHLIKVFAEHVQKKITSRT